MHCLMSTNITDDDIDNSLFLPYQLVLPTIILITRPFSTMPYSLHIMVLITQAMPTVSSNITNNDIDNTANLYYVI